jgi:fructose-1,6-bisphosphatase/inositol monophosphatase family enzyme
LDRVEALIREVAATEVMPRFRRLGADDIIEKGPGDLVTIADRAAEESLTRGLTTLLPGSIVVGEEAVSADPALLQRVGEAGPVWVVDPVDGTANFAAGTPPFAIMVGLLRGGEPVAGWIYDPVTEVAAVAELGGGAWIAGVRVHAPSIATPASQLRGPASPKYLPPGPREAVAAGSRRIGEMLPGRNCAGYEYPAIVTGEQHFAFFWRALAWDHVPGTLIVTEAGGMVGRLDGAPYRPADGRTGLLAAQNPDIWQAVRTTLLAELTD